jgi:hypothetical protein
MVACVSREAREFTFGWPSIPMPYGITSTRMGARRRTSSAVWEEIATTAAD